MKRNLCFLQMNVLWYLPYKEYTLREQGIPGWVMQPIISFCSSYDLMEQRFHGWVSQVSFLLKIMPFGSNTSQAGSPNITSHDINTPFRNEASLVGSATSNLSNHVFSIKSDTLGQVNQIRHWSISINMEDEIKK